jgi:TonB-linked SusC/RagA family outer membrane protein
MKNKVLITLTSLLMSAGAVLAQELNISGTVTDANSDPVVGATVVVKGTSVGTTTDVNGAYDIVASGDATLTFSFVGLGSKEEAVNGRGRVDVQLAGSDKAIDEVVVTAMGIKRSEKSLSYSVSQVGKEEIVKARETNLVNALAGKVAGVNILQSSGTVGGSSKIQIRGASSLSGGNDPIFVVDGLPISNQSYDPTRAGSQGGAVDVGNRAGDLNPDDVESISVLKGAAATALYGARAKNGAIVITTKKGSKGTTNITLNSSIRVDNALKLPEFQNEYAQGTFGVYDLMYLNGWGPKISEVQDVTYKDFKGDDVTLKAHPNNVQDFYQAGVTYMNSIAIDGAGDQSDYRVSVGTLNQEGIIPGSQYDRYSFGVNAGRDFYKNLNVRSSINYVNSSSTGRPTQSSNDANVLSSAVNGLPRTLDINDLKNNVTDEAGNPIALNSTKTANNPYWIINNNQFTNEVNRVYGNVVATWTILEGLTVSDNFGTDFFNENRRQLYRKGTFGQLNGKFTTWDINNQIVNNDLLLSYTKNINDDFNIKVLAGHNVNHRNWGYKTVQATDLTVDKLYTYTNAKSAVPTNTTYVKRLMGVFADVSLSWRETVFLDITGRNDWSSTLPKQNNSYFYPSVSGSVIFTEFLPKNNILSFGKLRLNWANVGSDEEPYQLDFTYTAAKDYFTQFVNYGTFPHGGQVAFTGPRVMPNSDLKPQNQVSWEGGADLRFFNGRLRLDVAGYFTNTKQQIVAIDVPLSTGYFAKNVNVGTVENKGIEIMLGGTPLKNLGGFSWDIDVNFAANRQTVRDLPEGLVYGLTSGWSGLQIKCEEGKSFGLYGTAWKRNDAGEYIINANTGLREVEANKFLDNIDPDFTLGINNTLSYKGINLSFLFDIRQGGVIFSGTVSDLRTTGLAAETGSGRDKIFIDKGVNAVVSGGTTTYQPNTTPVRSMQDFWGHYASTSNTEGSVFDASYVKLRELRLSYELPQKWIEKIKLKGLEVGFEARNLWIIKDYVPHVDPETNYMGPSNISGPIEFNSVPSTRTFGFNLKLTI